MTQLYEQKLATTGKVTFAISFPFFVLLFPISLPTETKMQQELW